MAAGAARVHNDGNEWYLFAQLEDVHEGCGFVIDSNEHRYNNGRVAG